MENDDLPLEEDEEEADILAHLLEVESEAAALALDASEEADKRRSAARQKAESEYHGRCEELTRSLEAWLSAEKESCDAALKSAFAEYDERLKALRKDFNSFYSFVDSILAGS